MHFRNGARRARPKFIFATLVTLAVTAIASAGPGSAHKLKTLYSFCAQSGCTDGDEATSLTMDTSGTLYATTNSGGDAFLGTVVEFVPDGRKWTYKRLYSFCAQAECADGFGPQARLIVDTAGNLYGTTFAGGAGGGGVIFELMPDAARQNWTYKILYTFCLDHGFCLDGTQPAWAGLTYAGAVAGLPYDGVSPLYGSTSGGGRGGTKSSAGVGTVFTLTPAAHGKWKHKLIYNFCSDSDKARCDDGGPSFTPAMDAEGGLYGTASGGTNFAGVVFALAPATGKRKQSLLHTFGASGSGDGNSPGAGVMLDGSGTVFGTTSYGGENDTDYYGAGGGTLYAVGGSYGILHSFCAQTACADGEYPSGSLTVDSSGTVFGTTTSGGNTHNGSGGGVVFRRDADGTFTVLHDFCSLANCADGVNPTDGVILAPSGKLYGITRNGGANQSEEVAGGTVFEIAP